MLVNDTYLQIDKVQERYGTSNVTISRWTKNREFPQPVKFGGGRNGRLYWLESELDQYDARRLAERAA
jgi:predicted DNA-binding transcriptional regulator AlpA